ncbi:MAG: hypothetical protein PHY28_05670 [Dehalococcoidales bacterium]|nr:hypothetical protein [Dehalococcoidales bacterium]
MEKHSYLMMLDNDRTVLNMLKKFVAMESSDEADSGQSLGQLSALSENIPNLVLVDITLPELGEGNSLEMIRNCSGTPIIKLSAKCEIATLSDALEIIMATNSANKSLNNLDSMSLLLSKLKKEMTTKFSEN